MDSRLEAAIGGSKQLKCYKCPEHILPVVAGLSPEPLYPAADQHHMAYESWRRDTCSQIRSELFAS
jgi:hypothetical protein